MSDRPSLATWLEPQHVHWSLRHVRELIPTERIAGPPASQVRILPSKPTPGLLDMSVETHRGDVVLSDFLATESRDALVVLHHGNIVLEWFSPDVGNDETHLIFSVTKSVTGLLVGALSQVGLLDLSAAVVDYVPEAAGGGFGDATIRQLLDMEASYEFIEDYSPGPDVVAYRHAAGWYPAPEQAPALHEFLVTRRADGAHGERFRYLSPTADMVGWVCARAARLSYAGSVEKYLWQPMGAQAQGHVTVDCEGTARAAGGLSVIPIDMARIGLIVAEGGAGIVSGEFIDDLTHQGSHERWAIGDFAEMFPHGAYRSFWYQPRTDPDVVLAMGIHGQMIYVDRARHVVVVIMSSWEFPDDQDWHLDNVAIGANIARTLGAH